MRNARINGFDVRDLANGNTYLRLPYYADQTKDAEWLARTLRGMSDVPDVARREILLAEDVFEGEPVIKNYDDDVHCPPKFRDKPIPLIPNSIYFGLFDCGQTLQPAFVLFQITPNPFQVQAILEVISNGGESMKDFAPRVMDACMQRVPGQWSDIRYWGDSTVTTRSGTDGRSARQEAKQWGMDVRPVSNASGPRRNAVEWLLSRWVDERVPGFLLDGVNCPVLRKALQGAYKYEVSKSGDSDGPGRVLMQPLKNLYSHVSDALQYGALKVRHMIEGTGGSRVRE